MRSSPASTSAPPVPPLPTTIGAPPGPVRFVWELPALPPLPALESVTIAPQEQPARNQHTTTTHGRPPMDAECPAGYFSARHAMTSAGRAGRVTSYRNR